MKLRPTGPVVLLAAVVWLPAARAATLTNDTLIDVGNTAYDGQDLAIQNCAVTINGPHAFRSLLLTNHAVLTHSPATNGQANYRINLTVTQGLTVDGSSRVDATGRGYAGASGPGAGVSSPTHGGGGGGHGGLGGLGSAGGSPGAAHDAILAPAQPGSGGGNGYLSAGGAGGGVIQLTIGGTLRVDGLITADGGAGRHNAYGGGGAGGSIAITASNLTGFGGIAAGGGLATGGNGGGGAGGRIALQLTTNLFAGVVSAAGGAGGQYGGAGTIFTRIGVASAGEVRVDNAGNAGQFTPLASPQPFDLTLANRAAVFPLSDLTNASVTLKTNGLLTHLPGQAGLTLTVLSNLVIEPGGRLDVSGQGHTAGAGPGAGVASATGGGGGGGHGGNGGSAAGAGGGAYDSITAPTLPGSGGGTGFASSGGTGGGVLRLIVGGTAQVDGALAANGAASAGYMNGGGGAGGSLWLTVGTLRGQGAITADGGASTGGGGGGGAGGRVAIYYQSNAFVGGLSAFGGAGLQRGGAGTVFTRAAGASHGAVLVHNGGNPGGLTRLNPAFWPAGEFFDLTLAGAATAIPETPMTFWSLALSSAAMLTHDPGSSGFHLTTISDLRLDTGTAIQVNALGHAAASGPGAGGSAANRGGGGGGYGGVGGSWTNTAAGGATYGSAEEPLDLGSGGGAGFLSRGGAGGGAVRLSVGGILRIDGAITADGGPGLDANYGGGGAGGSIFLSADVLTGTGVLSARGGGSVLGGGGGGGRIALYPRLIVGFTNVPSALGGASGNTNLAGQPGNVYYASNVAPLKVVSVTPAGAVMRPVAGVDVLFSAAVNPATFSAADVAVLTPTGAVSQAQIVVTPLAGTLFNLGFPTQTTLGAYQVKVGPHIQDLSGREMDQNGNRVSGEDPGDAFTNFFTLTRPIVSGAITAANGWPVRGVTVRASDNSATTTDTNGLYSLSLAPGWTGSVIPTLTGATFNPAARAYAALDANQLNQNYALATDLQPTLTLALMGTNARVAWPSLPPFKYQLQAADALPAWQNLGAATNGTGGALVRDVPISPARANRFFRVQVLLN